MDAIEIYFNGEKWQCLIGALISLLSLAFAIYLVKKSAPFHKGISYPFFVLSPALLLICIAIIIRSPSDLERVSNFLKQSPEKISSDELPRMQKVMANFEIIENVELAIIAIGLFLLIFFRKNPKVAGIGLGIAMQALLLLCFDLLAEKRGAIYLEFLMQLS